MDQFADLVVATVKAATTPLLARIAVLEQKAAVIPRDGINGKDGEPGRDADMTAVMEVKAELAEMRLDLSAKSLESEPTPVDVPALVAAVVAALPPAEKGEPGTPGRSVEPAEVKAMVAEAVAAIPKPQDGNSVTLEDVQPMVLEAVTKAVDGLPRAKDGVSVIDALVDRDGQLVQTFSDGRTKAVGTVVGRDVDMSFVVQRIAEEVAKIPVPTNGKDGVGFDDFDFEYDDDGRLLLRLSKGDQVKRGVVPSWIDRGVWREDLTYRKGDGATFGGSFFIAQRDDPGKPEIGDGWRLAVKRGRDGRNAKDKL